MVDLTRWNNPTSNSAGIAKFGVFSTERKRRDPNASLNTAKEDLGKYYASKGQTSPKVTINVAAGIINTVLLKQTLATLNSFRPELVDAPTPRTHLPRLGNRG